LGPRPFLCGRRKMVNVSPSCWRQFKDFHALGSFGAKRAPFLR
jgi:hypothetical protein